MRSAREDNPRREESCSTQKRETQCAPSAVRGQGMRTTCTVEAVSVLEVGEARFIGKILGLLLGQAGWY